MPPVFACQTLYKRCLLYYVENLFLCSGLRPKRTKPLRKYLLKTMHAGIRQSIIDIGCKYYMSYGVFRLFDFIRILLDKSIKRLDLTLEEAIYMLETDECARLFEYLDKFEGTGLQELVVKVRLRNSYRGGAGSVFPGNAAFHRALKHGLAASLHTLVLHSVCDNETLRLLGKHAVHLQHLDVSSSWLVDDRGLHQLLLQKPDACRFETDKYDTMQSLFASMWTISHAVGGPRIGVNACCSTLQGVRIQDTNTSEIGVALLLLFIPNLRSLGGFIYYRSVGEAIIALLLQSQNSLRLALTELWDTHLPSLKASVLSQALPNLSSLYTRATWLPALNNFPNLVSLTIDFDFIDFSHSLQRFCRVVPQMLKKMVLVDQLHAVDLGMIGELCPGLEELSAKLNGSWGSRSRQNANTLLPALHTCRARISKQETFRSLLVHTQNLQVFEVIMEGRLYDEERLTDELLSSALTERILPVLLTRFTITVSNSWCNMSSRSVRLMIQECPRLNFLGDLNDWNFEKRELISLMAEIKNKNWDFQLICQGEMYPCTAWRKLHDL